MEKLPPHDIDAEESVIGSLLIDGTAIYRIGFLEKEYFYDPNLHGLDWNAVYDRYRPLVDHVGRREDLNELMVEMIAEMQVGHNRTGGGDIHEEEGTATGLLGANLRVDDGRYQLTRVYTGESWNPFVAAPLATPGNEARAGEYILAVNGRDLTGGDNIFEVLQGTAGNQVTLHWGSDTPDPPCGDPDWVNLFLSNNNTFTKHIVWKLVHLLNYSGLQINPPNR